MDCQNWLVVDFDGTCSTDDTTPMLPRLAALCAKELLAAADDDDDDNDTISNGISKGMMPYEERQSKFSDLEDEYFALYKKAKEECQPPPSSTDQMTKREIISHLALALDRMDQVSNIVTAKVSSSAVLAQLQADLEHTHFISRILQKYKNDIKVGIRPHCGSSLRQVMQQYQAGGGSSNNAWGLAVLSINWCPSLISACVQAELDQGDTASTSNTMPIIWSNRVNSQTGNVELPIPGSLAKQKKIQSLRKESPKGGTIVYVGDSSTDLLAILEADIGILFGGSSSTIALVEQYGVTVKPLAERKGTEGTKELDKAIIWTTNCWSEIEAQMKDDDPNSWFR